MTTTNIYEISKRMYDEVYAYYDFLITSIQPQDYAMLQQTLHYPETYEEHIESLRSTMKTPQETIDNIKKFLTKYVEFQDDQYLAILQFVNRRIQSNPEHLKQEAYKILQQEAANNPPPPPLEDNEDEASSFADIPEILELQMGNSTIALETYSDPLMTNLYGILMIAFQAKYYGGEPRAGGGCA